MDQPACILIADDEPNLCQVVSTVLRKEGYQVLVGKDGEEALTLLQAHRVDLLLTDVIMRKVSGVELLRHVRESYPHIPVVMMTAYGTIKTAVDAIKLGAYNYLAKPFDMDEMKEVVRSALASRELPPPEAASPPRPSRSRPAFNFDLIVGQGRWRDEVAHVVQKVAPSRATVLVRGESGTGKELIARAIHANSQRRGNPFVAVACAALSSDLLESELFGHERGSFTGAIAQRQGRFELANGGTLFLDEIGDISPNLQLKLLRVLQEREFERVGGTKTIKVDVRMIAATNRDLERAVHAGQFRQDLYYRLQVVQIHLPPLRERAGDIPVLIQHFLGKYNAQNDRHLAEVDPQVMAALCRYPWPGNVRELENAIEHAVVMAEPDTKVMTADLLPAKIVCFPDERPAPPTPSRPALEPAAVEHALRACGGNVVRAARSLGTTPARLRNYLKRLGPEGGAA